MEEYRKERERQERISRMTGIVFTVAAHVAIVLLGTISGLKYIYPPPQEEAILIDFSESEEILPKEIRTGTKPRVAKPEPDKDIKLVQASEAQHKGTKANEAPEAVNDDFGDVETPEPKRKPEINKRALFSTADNKTDKDTLAQQTAAKITEKLKAGHSQGNTATGNTDGKPNAHLPGRTPNGALPEPGYAVQQAGKVVVKILVDQNGKVLEAIPGVPGTTVADRTLWEAAGKAAMEASFNRSSKAPAVQEGTITYVFTLKKGSK